MLSFRITTVFCDRGLKGDRPYLRQLRHNFDRRPKFGRRSANAGLSHAIARMSFGRQQTISKWSWPRRFLTMDGLLLRKCVVEFIGTFFLVFVIGCVSSQAHVFLAPLAIGAALMVMIFAGGHISGGDFKPPGRLGGLVRGKSTGRWGGFFLGAQIIVAVAGALERTLVFLRPHLAGATRSGGPGST